MCIYIYIYIYTYTKHNTTHIYIYIYTYPQDTATTLGEQAAAAVVDARQLENNQKQHQQTINRTIHNT